MFLPGACAKEACQFSYETIGVCDRTKASIASHPKVVALLLTLFHHAASSSRHDFVLDPFPIIADPQSVELALSPLQRDYTKILEVLAAIPCMKKLTEVASRRSESEFRLLLTT